MSTANIIGNAIFGLRNKSGGNYIDPAVKESLVGLWKFDQNTNESPTRNIIKNTIKDKGGDLELLNFGYKFNSGYGGYIEDFSLFILSNRFEYSEISNTKVTITAVLDNNTGIYHNVTKEESALYWNTFKIKVSGSTDDVYISYTSINKSIRLYNGINTVVVPNELSWHSFIASKANTSCNITLEFVPLYEGALVTDGKDDMIVSQKTVQEMLGGSKEITVVSMIHHINNNVYHTNYIRSKTRLLKNYLFEQSYGKSFIYGYTATNVGVTGTPSGNLTDVILGDKKDLYTIANNYTGIDSDSRFSIEGYINSNNGVLYELCEVAVYWTFIANKVLTTDEINQIIAYFKLDKYVTPQVIYDVKRQGLTNDTPAADWYLKDFSGNGHDMTLYNFAKKLGSGISKYEEDFTSWIIGTNINVTNYTIKAAGIVSSYVLTRVTPNSEIAPFTIKVTGIPKNGEIRYYYCPSSTKMDSFYIREDGQYNVPQSERLELTEPYRVGFTISNTSLDWSRLVIEQIPDYEGALVSDGIDDYGYADNLPIYKDYTVASKYSRFESTPSYLLSKAAQGNDGAFIFNDMSSSYSFGTSSEIDTHTLFSTVLRYQSKYINQGKSINAGSGIDTDSLWLSIIRDNDTRLFAGAFYSMLLFPYSLSEFLLERQLKKYKLGTLYPDMVEFRPIIKNNNQYRRIDFYTQNGDKKINPGDYVPINSILRANIYLNNELDELQSFRINGVNITFVKSSVDKTVYNIGNIPIAKSPQKIDITIDEYIGFEDII